MVLDNRHLFLSKLCWKRFRGYCACQIKKCRDKNPEGKRKALVEKYGYDVKFASHAVRLLRECEQIITEGTLDLTKDNDEIKAIRKGEWSLDKVESMIDARMLALETFYHSGKCKLPETPDTFRIRQLLFDCLESHYGSLGAAVNRPDESIRALREIDLTLSKVRRIL
jgi:hypothetical protein